MSEKQLIYAVDDDEGIRDLYSCALSGAGFDIACFADGESFFSALSEKAALPSLILLDIMLPGEDGYEILARLRADYRTKEIPVIMVSAKGEEISKVKGLNMGADDYIAKPFGVLELTARINANLRRTQPSSLLSCGDIELDDKKHEVRAAGETVVLTLKEYELLKLLLRRAPEVVGREEIINTVWGEDYIGETLTLDIHVATLRKKLGSTKTQINTVRGVGYLLQ